jgi:subtilisin family serine protease
VVEDDLGGGGRGHRGERTLHSLCRRFVVVFGVRAALVLAAGFLTLAGAAPAATAPVVVAVVDSGVNGPVPGLVPGWNAVDGSVDTRDTGGHGTGVAIVAAATCGGCRILPVRITDDSGSSTQGLVASGIRWAAGHGARVINLSWGLAVGGVSTGQVERAIASAVARGAVVTAAAMNDGSRDPNLNPWASRSPDAVRVAAVDDAGRLLSSTNRGIWVDLGARASATSGAAPRVAGAAAVVLAAHPQLTGLQVRAALRRGCAVDRALDLGWHCVLDVDGALRAAASPVPTYRLAVARTGRGTGTIGGSGAEIQCGEFCSDRLDAGTVVTLTAAPARGSRFLRWRGACRGAKRYCVVHVAGPATAVAVFAKTTL